VPILARSIGDDVQTVLAAATEELANVAPEQQGRERAIWQFSRARGEALEQIFAPPEKIEQQKEASGTPLSTSMNLLDRLLEPGGANVDEISVR
jgi:hypothetical protein